MTAPFDLPAYLERIALAEQPAPDVDGLIAVQRAHRLAIPFENLDVRLEGGINLDADHLFDKLVRRRRGGYCFEQNSVFLSALLAMGISVRPLLARVWLMAVDTPPKTHMLILVTLNGEEWIADAGFGGSYTPPMPLADGEAEAPDGVRYRLARDGEFGWMLARRAGDGDWSAQYSFTTARVWPSDIALGNHFTATIPGGLFVDNIFVNAVLPNGFASLFNRSYSRLSANGEEKSEIKSAKMLQLRLSLVFGIDLTGEEIDRLGLF